MPPTYIGDLLANLGRQRPDASAVSRTPRKTPGLLDMLGDARDAVDRRVSSTLPEGTLTGVLPDWVGGPEGLERMAAGLPKGMPDLAGAMERLGPLKPQPPKLVAPQQGPLMRAVDMAPQIEAPAILTNASKPFKAWHGSPYTFDKFSMENVGTGEGAASYGHGLYFAENQKVAKTYRDKLTPKASVHISGEPIALGNQTPRVAGKLVDTGAEDFIRRAAEHGDPAKALQEIRKFIAEDELLMKSGQISQYGRPLDMQRELKAAEELMPHMVVGPKQKGRLYEVSIDASPEELLRWDERVVNQPALLNKLPDLGYTPMSDDWQKAFPGALRSPRATKFFPDEAQGQDIVQDLGWNKAASEKLKDIGIVGTQYLDGASRVGKTARETSNYVMFDPERIKILKMLGIGEGHEADRSGNPNRPRRRRRLLLLLPLGRQA